MVYACISVDDCWLSGLIGVWPLTNESRGEELSGINHNMDANLSQITWSGRSSRIQLNV